jgi:serine phosphatase RsbU (regulator of sigma subunit)
MMFGLFVVCVGVRAANPTDGTRLAPGFIGAWQPDGVLVVPIEGEASLRPNGFRANDKVIAIDGVPMTEVAAGLFTGSPVSPLALGQTREYTVVRDGRTLTLAAEPQPYPVSTLLAKSWGALLSTLVLLFIAGVAFAQRPQHPLVQALVLMSLAGWGVVAYSIGLNLADMFDPPRFWLWLLLIVTGILLYMIGLVRVSLTLAPLDTPLFRAMNRPVGVLLTGLVPILGAFIYLFLRLAAAQNALTWLELWIPTFALASGLVIFIAIVFLGLSYRGNQDEDTRRKIRLVVAGGLISTLIILIANAIPILVLGQPLLDANVLSLSALPVTIAMGIAIFRYRLIDIDFVISRTLVYAAVTGAMLAIYLTALLVLLAVLGPMAGGGVSQIISILALAFTVGLGIVLFNSLRDRIQLAVDRRFYRSRYVARQLFTQFAFAARNQVDVDKLKTDLTTVIEDAMEPSHVSIVDAASPSSEKQASAVDPQLAAFIGQAGLSVIDAGDAGTPASISTHLRAQGTRLAVPLVSQGTLIGVIKLGERRDSRAYSLDDRRLLALLGEQVASPLHTAQLARAQQLQAVERERLEQELSIARRIQLTLLPQTLPSLAGYTLRAFYQPARAVGSDLYDFVELPDGKLGIFIGDVSDKGVPAAMVMTAARTVLRSQARALASPGSVLRVANDILQPDVPTGMFVTCFYALLDVRTGSLHYANAGHSLPLRSHAGQVSELHARGMPLGLLPNMEYEAFEAHLPPGCTVLFYSDGLVEAHNAERAMFGDERLRASIQGQASHSLADPIERVLADLHAFVGPAWEQEDDISMVSLSRDPD